MLAEISLRRGDLDEARERFRFVLDAHPRSDWANDALDRLAFMRDNLDGEGSAEARYFEAVALRDRGDGRMARDLLLEIAGTRGEPLADDALALLAEIAAEQGDARKAADRWLSVAEQFPESMLAPRALLRAAALLRDELEDAPAAAAALTRITEDYPDSAAAHQARAQLELLPPPRS
jgi:TolA-binding protein